MTQPETPLETSIQTATRKRLSRSDRRAQMLEVAQTLIEEDGADALTLASVAERAGVSKPMAYDHFETRSGLLLALLAEADSHYEGVARARMASAPETVEAISEILAEAYVACAMQAGPAALALIAAIEANGDARDLGRVSRDKHVDQFAEAFASVLKSAGPETNLIFVGLIAAGNALCTELTNGRIAEKAAVQTLAHLLSTSIAPFAR